MEPFRLWKIQCSGLWNLSDYGKSNARVSGPCCTSLVQKKDDLVCSTLISMLEFNMQFIMLRKDLPIGSKTTMAIWSFKQK
jgi:hypothetical protein